MLSSTVQNLENPNQKIKEQASLNLNEDRVQTLGLIGAIEENNQAEFFRILNLQIDQSGRRVIDEINIRYGGNALHAAIMNGYLDFIAPLIAAGIDVNQKDNDAWTPVYIAAENGYSEIITALKAGGADVDMRNSDGVTPAYIAAENRHVEAIIALKAAGANMDTPDNNGSTPLFIAAQMGYASVITALLEAGANASIRTPSGTPLEGAQNGAEPGCPEVVRLLETHLEQYPNGIKPKRSTNKELAYRAFRHPVTLSSIFFTGLAFFARIYQGINIHGNSVCDAASNGNVNEIIALKDKAVNVNTLCDGVTPVYIAAERGHAETITALYAAGADVNTPDKRSCTPVYIAAQEGHEKAITALHIAGANVDTPNNDQATPVYIAAQEGHAKAITALHVAGANVDMPRYGVTPVYIAAERGHAKAITALHTARANVNRPNNEGKTPIYIAAEKGHAKAIAALLNTGADASVKIPGYLWGWLSTTTALEGARRGKELGHLEVVGLLEVHFKKYPGGIKSFSFTSICAAASNGDAEKITELKALGENVHTLCDGVTPIYIAAEIGSAETITALYDAGANVNTPDKRSCTPVYIAAKEGHAKAITALHAAGANVDTPNNDQATPVYIAAERGHAKAIIALHVAGANVDTSRYGTTPIYIAAERGHAKAITALHTARANVERPNNEGKTPIYIAAERGHAEAIMALLEAGADASIKTKWGTALECVKKDKDSGHRKVVQVLEAHFGKYPNGTKPVRAMNPVVSFSAKSSSSFEQKNLPIYNSPPPPSTKPIAS